MKFTTLAIVLVTSSRTNAFVQNTQLRGVKTSLPSYLDDIGGGASAPKAGIGNYLDTVAIAPARVGGAGIGNYLDTVNSACNAVQPTPECAEAITDYMGALSTGDAPASSASEGAQAIGNHLDSLASNASALSGAGFIGYLNTVATAPVRAGGAGILNHLDGVSTGSTAIGSSAPAVKSYLDALASGDAAAPAAPAVQEYLSDVSTGAASAPTSGDGIVSYLAAMGSATALSGGAGILSHVNALASGSQLSGAGIGSYLDSVNVACDGASPTSVCAEAITDYTTALSSGDAPSASSGDAAQAIGSYLDHLASGSALAGGAGFGGHLSSLGSTSAIQSSAVAVKSYLDGVSGGAVEAPSAPAVAEYLDDMSSGAASAPTSGEGILSYLAALGSATALSGGAGILSHVNALASGSQLSGAGIGSYLDGVSGGAVEASAAAPAAPAAPAVQEYSAAPSSGDGIVSYLAAMGSATALSGGAGILSHVNALASGSQLSGAGIGSYLDSVNVACDGASPTSVCAEAITDYTTALSSGDAPSASSGDAAQAIGSYLDHLASGSALAGGAGFGGHLSSLGSTSAIQSSAVAVKSYLDGVSGGAVEAPSAPAVAEYLDDMSSGAASAPTSGAGLGSYLTALGSATALSGGAGILSHVNALASGSQLSGAGVTGYLDMVSGSDIAAPVANVPAVVASSPAAAGAPSTKIDTQVSHNGLQTTITITSVTTVVIDDAE